MAWTWVGFISLVILLLGLDLGLASRNPRPITLRQAIGRSALWIALALCFAAVVYDGYANHRFGLGTTPDPVDGRVNTGVSAVAKYLTGYVLEKSLSIDNLFVMAVIFRFLAVPAKFQQRVLLWGILGSMVLRGVLIGVGVQLITHYHWVLYIFGAFLLLAGTRLLILPERSDPARRPALRIARKFLPLTPRFAGGRFVTIENGRRVLTPLALALVMIEGSDVVFATDSIPAVFAVTGDPLLIFTSNILAILGLRALYFALAGLIEKFRYLNVSLAIVLALVGAKILAHPWLQPALGDRATLYLLIAVAAIFAGGIVTSLLLPRHWERSQRPSVAK